MSSLTFADSGVRVAAWGAEFLLDVERGAATSTAQSVRLVVTLTKWWSTLGLEKESKALEWDGDPG